MNSSHWVQYSYRMWLYGITEIRLVTVLHTGDSMSGEVLTEAPADDFEG